MPKGRSARTDHARARFLDVLRSTCNVSEAARAIGLARSAAYEWRDADPGFAADWVNAEQEAADKLEREAWRRAVEGTDKPIVHQGEVTGTYKEYSDKLLEILLKGHRPERFVDRVKTDLSGTVKVDSHEAFGQLAGALERAAATIAGGASGTRRVAEEGEA